jgi:hypothetical protein
VLVFSKFLRLAAAKRQAEEEVTEESKAFEGLLLGVYGGNESAVTHAFKLISASDESVTGIDGVKLEYTCKLAYFICCMLIKKPATDC